MEQFDLNDIQGNNQEILFSTASSNLYGFDEGVLQHSIYDTKENIDVQNLTFNVNSGTEILTFDQKVQRLKKKRSCSYLSYSVDPSKLFSLQQRRSLTYKTKGGLSLKEQEESNFRNLARSYRHLSLSTYFNSSSKQSDSTNDGSPFLTRLEVFNLEQNAAGDADLEEKMKKLKF